MEVLLAGLLYRWLRPDRETDIARLGNLFLFMGVGGLVAPACSAGLAALIMHSQMGFPFAKVFWTWMLADSLGLMMLVPLLAGTTGREFRDLLGHRMRMEFLGSMLVIPLATMAVIHGHASWIFLLSPLFLWAVFRFGFAGVATAIFLTALSGVAMLLVDFRAGRVPDFRTAVAFLQFFLFVKVVVFLPIGGLVKALRESEAQLRLIFEKAPIGMAIMESTSGRFLSGNPRMAEILGESLDQLHGRTFQDYTHPDHLEADLASVRALAEGRCSEVEKVKRYLHPSGRPVWARLKMVRLPDVPGQPPRHLSLVEDITAATLATEDKLQALDRLEKITERVPGVVYQYRLNPDGTSGMPYASDALYDIYHVSPWQVRESVEAINAVHHPEDHAGILASIQASAATLKPWKHSYRVQFEDGTVRDLYGDAVPEREPDGSILWTGFIADITERRQMETRLAQSQKMDSLGVLAGGVAHDMNNVLGAILGMASTQIEATPENTPAHRALGTIIKAAERGGRVVRGLLSFARRSPAQEQEVNINDILREEVHLLERTTLAKVALELDLAPDLRAMRGDGSALNYALMNLCVNAVDAMPDQGKLILRTRNLDGDRIEVQVEDNGAGMPPEVLERALDPFFTTKADGKGTGLGLSLVYSTVKAHQGTLDIQSEPGKGTCVRLTFPALAGVPTDDGLQVQSGPLRSAVGLKVLLVDDDELIRSSMESVLEALGHTGILASSGEEALALLERGTTPDLVVLDMNMPGIGGAGTLPRIRARWPRLPVLLATGRADQAAQDLVDAHAVASLLSKPFSIREFQESLEGLARRH